jgi:hypothetical protein
MVTSMDWRLDSNVLVSTSQDASVKTWDMFTGNQLKSWNAHGGGTTSVRFAKDGRVVTSGRDRTVKLWDQDGKELKAFGGFSDLALQAAIGHDEKTIIAGTFDGIVRLFNGDDASPLGELRANPLTVASRLEAIRPEAALAQRTKATEAVVPALAAVITSADAVTAARAPLADAVARKQAADAALANAQAAAKAATDALGPLKAAVEQAQQARAAAEAALAAKAPAVEALVATAERLEAQRDALVAELNARQPEPTAAAAVNEE